MLFVLGERSALASSDEKLQHVMTDSANSGVEELFNPLLFAFLNDLNVATVRNKARQAFDIVSSKVARIAGIRTNLGKPQLCSKDGGPCFPGCDDFQAFRAIDAQPLWACDAPQIKSRGIVAPGSPPGTGEFCKAHAEKRTMNIEQQLLDWIPQVPTLQIAWLLYFCEAQRERHLIITIAAAYS